MQTDTISARNACCLLVLMSLCTTVLSGAATVGQDLWLATGLAAILFFPLLLVCARICKLLPGKGLFDIIQELFGKTAGFLLTLLLAGYAVCVTALLLRNFVEFTVIIALDATPRIPLMLALFLTVLSISHKGINVLGRWSLLISILILTNMLLTILLGMDLLELSHLLPMLQHSPAEMLANASALGSSAFGELVLVTVILGHLRKGESPYRVYIPGLLIGSASFILIILRNLTILGQELVQTAKFAAYMAVRIVHFGSFFERLESLISINLILLGITKMSLCLTAASMGTAKLLRAADYKQLLLPVGLLATALCSLLFKNVYDMLDFVWAYRFFALPAQALVPLCVWVRAEVYVRKNKPQSPPAHTADAPA